MKLVNQLRVAFLLFLGLGIVNTGFTMWSLNRSEQQFQQSELSHHIYSGYLMLESHVYQLFKQYGDAIIIGDTRQRVKKVELMAGISRDLENLSLLVQRKVDLQGKDQQAGTARLEAIESQVGAIIAQLDRYSPTGTGENLSNRVALSALLNEEIDENLKSLIQDALTQELQWRSAIDQNIESGRQLQKLGSLCVILLSMVSLLLIFRNLRTRITEQINRLLGGIRSFSDGEQPKRIVLAGSSELREIAEQFNRMADKVWQQQSQLSTEKLSLKRSVDERTLQLSRLLEERKQQDDDRREMIADVSHEIRTPITIIKGEAEIALRSPAPTVDGLVQSLVKIVESANHTARLVDDLLFISRAENGKLKLKLVETNVDDLIRSTLQLVDKTVVYEPCDASLSLSVDRDRVRQALLVLLENALRHGVGGVCVSVESNRQGVSVMVSDRGPGMSQVEKQQAFRRYYRGSNAASRYSSGVGLGLPVALAIAEAHGGTIVLRDGNERGLVAEIFFPCTSEKDIPL